MMEEMMLLLGSSIDYFHRVAVLQLILKVWKVQGIALFKSFPVLKVRKGERHYSKINQVLPVNTGKTHQWFEVLQTTGRSQAAVMGLDPGKATGRNAEAHEKSEQLLLLIEGVLAAEIGSERFTMNAGDMVIIPAGVKHKFTSRRVSLSTARRFRRNSCRHI
jgi:mannose-6-phosphate isomerase-like protein (cupin superfamily)